MHPSRDQSQVAQDRGGRASSEDCRARGLMPRLFAWHCRCNSTNTIPSTTTTWSLGAADIEHSTFGMLRPLHIIGHRKTLFIPQLQKCRKTRRSLLLASSACRSFLLGWSTIGREQSFCKASVRTSIRRRVRVTKGGRYDGALVAQFSHPYASHYLLARADAVLH